MKRIQTVIISVILSGVMLASSAYGALLPEPDWAGILKERKAMVNETDFELYVESNNKNSVYYGAKFEPEKGVYIGMTADSAESFKPLGCYITYVESYTQSDLYYPSNSMIKQDNVITMAGWNVTTVHNINYDDADKTLAMLNSYNKPMFVRFANEMNCSNLGDDPEQYVEAFRKVADLIHKYPNLAVVWSPNDIGGLDKPFEYYYPGDEYVDWIGVSCYTRKYFNNNPKTTYDDSIYFITGDFGWPTNKVKPIMDFMAKNNIKKPVMLSEGGVETSNVFGDTPVEMEKWSAPRLRNMYWNLIMKYPQIKMINYFNVYRKNESERFNISEYGYACDIFKEAASGGAYIRSLNGSAEFTFANAEKAGEVRVKDGKMNIYTLAHVPLKSNITVEYKLDDGDMGSADNIPYKMSVSLSGISDGKHTITIESEGLSRTYDFYKSGEKVSFGREISGEAQKPKDSGIKVYIKESGKLRELAFDQPPVIIDGRTLVPVRAVFEAMGMSVNWDNNTKTAYASGGETNIISIGAKEFYRSTGSEGRKNLSMDVPAQIISGRTLVPLRAVAEACDAEVEWVNETKTIYISDWQI